MTTMRETANKKTVEAPHSIPEIIDSAMTAIEALVELTNVFTAVGEFEAAGRITEVTKQIEIEALTAVRRCNERRPA